MSFGLARGRQLDPGGVGVLAADLPPLSDNPPERELARIDPRGWFADPARPFEIEIGSGKGGFLVESAGARQGVNLLGIEWAKEFWRYTADRCRRHGLANVRVLHADAVEFLKWRVAPGVADVIHLYYSDPWPKKRHHKRRVVRDEFLAEAHRTLRPGGQLRIVTDHDEYWAWMEDHFAQWCDGSSASNNSGTGVPPVRAVDNQEPTFDPDAGGLPVNSRSAPGSESRATPGEAAARSSAPCDSCSPMVTESAPMFARLRDADAHAAIRAATAAPAASETDGGGGSPASLVRTNYERKFTSDAKPPHAAVLVRS